MNFIEYASLILLYLCVSCIIGGYLYKKVGTWDGPDGLIPLFGGLFWPVYLVGYSIIKIIEWLFNLGKNLG